MRIFRFTVLFAAAALITGACAHNSNQNKVTDSSPQWAKKAIWYQIFVERFSNGDPDNDPSPLTISTASDFVSPPENWHITPWTNDWYKRDDWAKDHPGDFYSQLQLRRYGGDLKGVLDKLDYLVDLGITAVYFNPLNDAPSLHKYDARNYHHIDVNFGPDPMGDMQIIASENPADPSTWKWTSADKLFLEIVKTFHNKGIRIILDYSWNHTGVEFWAWKDVLKNQEQSAFKDWYEIESFDNPETEENEFRYKGWLNISSLPELRKANTTEAHRSGFPYEGNLDEATKAHIFAVTQRWLSPDGNKENGIDGFRLDVADHVPMGFWREYRQFVKNINPDAYLTGEIWWQDFPDKLMNPVPYVSGDVFDAIMFYQIYRPARYFFAKTVFEITADQFKDSLEYQWNRLGEETIQVMMNTASTHDSPRLLSSFSNRGKYKFRAKPSDDPDYHTGKPDEETYQRVKLYQVFQFTIPGAPHIWNGEELGMWGADDPDCRKPLWWPGMTFEPENRNNILQIEPVYEAVGFNPESHAFYKKLIQIRKENPALSLGKLEFLKAVNKTLVYSRKYNNETLFVAFNVSLQAEEISLAGISKSTDLLSGLKYDETIVLEPLSAVILRPDIK